jgi:hypothetical protein
MLGQYKWVLYEVEMKNLYDTEKNLWEKKKDLLAQYFQVLNKRLKI